jgi:uncharacterized protein (DUF1501 family)
MVQQNQPDVASDYKALVCIFLNGGSDCNNMVIPFDDYTVTGGGTTNGYDNVRTASGLAVPKSASPTRRSPPTLVAYPMPFTQTFRRRLTTRAPVRPSEALERRKTCRALQCWFAGFDTRAQ